jgi:cystathionine gamma-synthase
MKSNRQPPHPATLAAQGLGWTDAATGAVVLPIQPATTYIRDPDNQYRRGRNYARADNPGYDQPQALLTALEGGAASLVFSSGMAAATTVFRALPVGAHVVGPRVMYHSLRRWIAGYAAEGHIATEFVDTTSLDALRQAVVPGRTRLVWIETPANPLWSVTDIAGAAEIAHRAGALLAVDSTTASPVLTRPIEHGADIVMHSATKYLNGHSDVIAGSLTAARDDEFWQRLVAGRSSGGAILGSLEACTCASSAPAARRSWSPRRWPSIRMSPRCSIPACRTIPAMLSPRGRCPAGSAACCRSGSRAARKRRSRPRRGSKSGSARPRWAGSRA